MFADALFKKFKSLLLFLNKKRIVLNYTSFILLTLVIVSQIFKENKSTKWSFLQIKKSVQVAQTANVFV